ncbi:hypothetical protein HOLleu_01137 [Holothuria leucospilota]|uniref:Uncharacterized protein n=1 Tax=Holothuria leucospilota TaxID=206669 RepID=A0A9Q1CNN1_HOLLE|nr:hypothetical protein HOLleu_01137 [Holothuria leucospilota]
MLKLQKQRQDTQNVKISRKLSQSPIYVKGQLVYLYKPTSSSLTTNSRKTAAEWCGPFVIHEVLDRTHYVLATLKGDILSDVFNFNKLKPCFIRSAKQNITSVQKLTDALKQSDSNHVNMFSNESPIVEFHDEHVLPEVTRETVLCLSYTDPVCIQPYLEACEHNKGLAFPYLLKHEEYLKQFKLLSKAPKGDLEILRARYKLGQLQVLLSLDPGKKSSFWWNVG